MPIDFMVLRLRVEYRRSRPSGHIGIPRRVDRHFSDNGSPTRLVLDEQPSDAVFLHDRIGDKRGKEHLHAALLEHLLGKITRYTGVDRVVGPIRVRGHATAPHLRVAVDELLADTVQPWVHRTLMPHLGVGAAADHVTVVDHPRTDVAADRTETLDENRARTRAGGSQSRKHAGDSRPRYYDVDFIDNRNALL